MQLRSLHSLARRALAAGAASALALTLFNAVQPSLRPHRIGPGTVEDVPLTLVPTAAPAPAGAAAAGAVDRRAGAASRLLSAPVAVGKARFVGFSWPVPVAGPPGGAGGRVWLRARTAAGWSGWREVEPAADGPDATSPEYRRPERVYSDGQWLDAGTVELQVRVDQPAPEGAAASPGSVAAHLITPDMTATPGTEPPRAGVATAATARPGIISRRGWGAVESLRRAAPSYSSTVKAAVIHHTVQSNRYPPSESAALVRADYLYHVRTRGWNDIGDNFLVDRYGRVFEGRYGGVTRAVLGAHAGGFNTYTTGVAMLGTFSSARPPAAMVAAMQRLLAWKLDLTHVDPAGRTILRSAGGANVRHPAGRRLFIATIFGHRSTSFTDCPGGPTIGLLRSIRAAVSRIGRPKIYGGMASAARIRPERGGSVALSARFSSRLRWRVRVSGSNLATVRAWGGVGTRARVRWYGHTSGGFLAPPGWATVTVTAGAGRAEARPVVSRVYVDRRPPPAGTSTGGFASGAWRVSNANVEQLSRTARVFASYRFGRAGDIPVVGDWDGDGTQTLGVVRPERAAGTNRFLLRNSRGPGLNFTYGRYGDRLLVGDWDGNGTWTPGILRGGTRWYLKNSFAGGRAAVGLAKQTPGIPVVGNWDNRP